MLNNFAASTEYIAPRGFALFIGAVWSYFKPTLDFAIIMVAVTILDCVSAWRLNRRVRKKYPSGKADGKLKSCKMMDMLGTLFVAYMAATLGYHLDRITPIVDFSVGNWITIVFVLVQLISIAENESSCNGNKWAVVLQKVLQDKTKRHLDTDVESIINEHDKKYKRKRTDKSTVTHN